ncbi:hypothetical protein RUM43_011443, partial [Polyplax serrata]
YGVRWANTYGETIEESNNYLTLIISNGGKIEFFCPYELSSQIRVLAIGKFHSQTHTTLSAATHAEPAGTPGTIKLVLRPTGLTTLKPSGCP